MSKIAAAPVRSFRNPKYPTKLEVQADSELLKKHLPAGWIRFLGTAGAAGVVLANLQGCAPQPPVIMGDIALETVIISLSEEEGLGIIKEELAKSGIPFSQMNVEWSEVQIPNAPKPLNVDLVDPDHKVAVEFVSSNEQFSDLGVESNSTVSLPALAENIKAAVTEKGPKDYAFKAFYAQVEVVKTQANQEQWRSEAKEQLRQQVQDFVNWLKSQGVI